MGDAVVNVMGGGPVGLAAAALLQRGGFPDVNVYEQAANTGVREGGGLSLAQDAYDVLALLGIPIEDVAVPTYVYRSVVKAAGKWAYQDAPSGLRYRSSWPILTAAFRARLLPGTYHPASRLTVDDIRFREPGRLRPSGSAAPPPADLWVIATGAASSINRSLFEKLGKFVAYGGRSDVPPVEPAFCGLQEHVLRSLSASAHRTVIWRPVASRPAGCTVIRGLVPFESLSDEHRAVMTDSRGEAAFLTDYRISGRPFDAYPVLMPGHRRAVSWTLSVEGPVAPNWSSGPLPDEAIAWLHDVAKNLDPVARHLVRSTSQPFLAHLVVIPPSNLVHSRRGFCEPTDPRRDLPGIVRLGDTASTVPPQLGRGVNKGLNQARRFAEAFCTNGLGGLRQWEHRQLERDWTYFIAGIQAAVAVGSNGFAEGHLGHRSASSPLRVRSPRSLG